MHAIVLASVLGVWIELLTGAHPDDDISYTQSGTVPGEFWVGTEGGFVYRTFDYGRSFHEVFRPVDHEPLVDVRLDSVRRPNLPDLNRAEEGELGRVPSEERGKLSQDTDLAGGLVGDVRNAGARLPASISRQAVRDSMVIERITRCDTGIFIGTNAGLWRSRDDGISWQRLNTAGLSKRSESVTWVTCKDSRVVITGGDGVLESLDGGDTFLPLRNTFPYDPFAPQTIIFNDDGRLWTLHDNRVYRENDAQDGWERICDVIGDSTAAHNLKWVWGLSTNEVWAVAGEGPLRCKNGVTERVFAPRLAGQPLVFLWLNQRGKGHRILASNREIFESFDGGETFDMILRAPTTRSILRIEPMGDNLLVVTGGQLLLRVVDDELLTAFSEPVQNLHEGSEQQAPMGMVVRTALQNYGIDADTQNEERQDVGLQGLVPIISVDLVHRRFDTNGRIVDRGTVPVDFFGARDFGLWGYQVTALWDLSQFVFDPLATSSTWVDLERLRRRVMHNVQDYYVAWARTGRALHDAQSPRETLYLLTRYRQASAYLDEITGHAFEVFRRPVLNGG